MWHYVALCGIMRHYVALCGIMWHYVACTCLLVASALVLIECMLCCLSEECVRQHTHACAHTHTHTHTHTHMPLLHTYPQMASKIAHQH